MLHSPFTFISRVTFNIVTPNVFCICRGILSPCKYEMKNLKKWQRLVCIILDVKQT